MKLDLDCVRNTLLAIEDNLEYGEDWTIEDLHSHLPDFTLEELQYTCLKLHEGGYLNITTVNFVGSTSPQVARIHDLTFSGHEFISTIRRPEIYEQAKSKAKALGATTLRAISTIATGILESVIKSQLGL